MMNSPYKAGLMNRWWTGLRVTLLHIFITLLAVGIEGVWGLGLCALALPVVIAASSGLGTINHTLLTLEALRARTLAIAGIVLVGEPNYENKAAIEARAEGVRVLADLPLMEPLDAAALEAWAVEACRPAVLGWTTA